MKNLLRGGRDLTSYLFRPSIFLPFMPGRGGGVLLTMALQWPILQVYERAGISLVEVYERVGKSIISVCKKTAKGITDEFYGCEKRRENFMV